MDTESTVVIDDELGGLRPRWQDPVLPEPLKPQLT